MKTIVLAETDLAGHRLPYLVAFARAFAEAGCRVVCLSPQPEELGRALDGLVAEEDRYTIPYSGNLNPYEKWGALGTFLRQHKETIQPDLVFIPYLDGYFYLDHGRFPKVKTWLLDSLFPFAWAGLLVHPEYLPAAATTVLVKSEQCKRLFLLDERYVERLASQHGVRHMERLPDFADSRTGTLPEELAALFADAPGLKVVSLGHMARRKGVLTLLDMAQVTAETGTMSALALGKFDPLSFSAGEWERLQSVREHPPANVRLWMEALPDEAIFNAVIAAADVVYIGYLDFPHSSNLLTKAAQLRKPVLASREGVIGERVVEYGLGEVFDPENVREGLAALEKLRAFQFDEERMAAFLEAHSEDRLREAVQRLTASL